MFYLCLNTIAAVDFLSLMIEFYVTVCTCCVESSNHAGYTLSLINFDVHKKFKSNKLKFTKCLQIWFCGNNKLWKSTQYLRQYFLFHDVSLILKQFLSILPFLNWFYLLWYILKDVGIKTIYSVQQLCSTSGGIHVLQEP